MNTTLNLPQQSSTDSSDDVKLFFNKYFTHQISFPSNQIDAVLGFFLKNGFEEQAAKSTAIVLLNQARIDNVNPMQLIDTLKSLNGAQLSQVVTEIINLYREKTSFLGYKTLNVEATYESRNIAQ
jgi:hypothetical protein